eukprot:CAMPEP_0204916130 /NCGR_PEP_ID=MMETSP1397-20131031/14020_1 /ASSEMBLY_ACC=CAM_ASM_000891 /TAXON_ID=49980 /ORGANISM="Climacostomum Climacostomum virens, Strain Stock W-24" /LENGTH=243 /DNA_ID=CAMNT_0052088519 /DNA_START=415 /DNA_END=1146 /DNA_ORIENTATION=-
MKRFFSSLKESRKMLDIVANATEQDIKAAFYKRAKQVHPDSSALVNKEEAAKQFRDLTDARDECLNNLGTKTEEEPAYNYETLRKKQDYWEKREFYSQETTKKAQEERKERERKRQESWDSRAKAPEAEPWRSPLQWGHLGIAAGISIAVILFYCEKAVPRPLKPRTYFNYQRGLTNAYTDQKSEPLKREVPIEILEDRFEPHFVFIQLSYDDLGASTMYKCTACNHVVGRNFLAKHAHQKRK